MIDKNLEQIVKIGKSVSETLALLTVAYDEYVMKKWQSRFKEGARRCAR